MLRERGRGEAGRWSSIHWFTVDKTAGLTLLTGTVIRLVWSWSRIFPAIIVSVGAATTTRTERYTSYSRPSNSDSPVLAEGTVAPVGRSWSVPVVGVRVPGGGVGPRPRSPVVVLTSPGVFQLDTGLTRHNHSAPRTTSFLLRCWGTRPAPAVSRRGVVKVCL